jgi:hypothetical protein
MDDGTDMIRREPNEPDWYDRKTESEQRIIRGSDSDMGSDPELTGNLLEKGVRENSAITNDLFGLQ